MQQGRRSPLKLSGTGATMTLLSLGGALAACPTYKYTRYEGTSHDAAGLEAVVEAFEDAFGGENNGNEPGPLPEGYRKINWDGAALPFDMPPDAFQNTRGGLFSSKDNKFAVSNPSVDGPADDNLFSTLLPFDTSKEFQTFSPPRLFTSVLDNKVETTFSIPGSNGYTPATTKGFGAVFVDVDKWHTTKMSYYDKNECPIAKVYIPPKSAGLSFVGLAFEEAVVYKVVQELGEVSIYEAGMGTHRKLLTAYEGADVVILDDFVYGEPQPIEAHYGGPAPAPAHADAEWSVTWNNWPVPADGYYPATGGGADYPAQAPAY